MKLEKMSVVAAVLLLAGGPSFAAEAGDELAPLANALAPLVGDVVESCKEDIAAYGTLAQQRRDERLTVIKNEATQTLRKVLSVLATSDGPEAKAEASALLSELLNNERPDSWSKLAELQEILKELEETGAIGARASELMDAIHVRLARTNPEGPGWKEKILGGLRALPLVGTRIAHEDINKPTRQIIAEIRADADERLDLNARFNDRLKVITSAISEEKEIQENYAAKLEVMARGLQSLADSPQLADDKKRFLAVSAEAVLREVRTSKDIILLLTEGISRGSEMGIILNEASIMFRADVSVGITRLALSAVQSEALRAAMQTAEDASFIRRGAARTELAIAQTMVYVAKLNKRLQEDRSNDSTIEKARRLIEQASQINASTREVAAYQVDSDIHQLNRQIGRLELSNEQHQDRVHAEGALGNTLAKPIPAPEKDADRGP